MKNAYGTNQEHLEPDVIEDILIPLPKDPAVISSIGQQVLKSIESLEDSIEQTEIAERSLAVALGG